VARLPTRLWRRLTFVIQNSQSHSAGDSVERYPYRSSPTLPTHLTLIQHRLSYCCDNAVLVAGRLPRQTPTLLQSCLDRCAQSRARLSRDQSLRPALCYFGLSQRSMPREVPSSVADRCQLAAALASDFRAPRHFELRPLTARRRAISLVPNSTNGDSNAYATAHHLGVCVDISTARQRVSKPLLLSYR